MSAKANDWCDPATLLFQHRLDSYPEVDIALPQYRDAAVEQIAQYTGLPLVDRTAVVDFHRPKRENGPVFLGRILYPHTVKAVRYWDAPYEEGTVPGQTWDLSLIHI